MRAADKRDYNSPLLKTQETKAARTATGDSYRWKMQMSVGHAGVAYCSVLCATIKTRMRGRKQNDQQNAKLLLLHNQTAISREVYRLKMELIKKRMAGEMNGKRTATCLLLARGHLIASRSSDAEAARNFTLIAKLIKSCALTEPR